MHVDGPLGLYITAQVVPIFVCPLISAQNVVCNIGPSSFNSLGA